MKKSLLVLALFGAFAGAAHAQSSVTIYGTVDAGFSKRTGTTLNIGKRANNKLGFKGVEDLGNGLKALFQLEIRYEPDTGTIESVTRPLFQGESRVGLQGGFGMVRLGRGLTAFQASSTLFDPFNGLPTPAGFQTDLTVAGYHSDPFSPAGNSTNRISNAIFYNSNEIAGFQFNASIGTKEPNGGPAVVGRGTTAAPQYALGANASANPFSVSATYKNGPVAAMVAYERNAIESKLQSVAGSLMVMPELKLTASYTQQDREHTVAINPETKAFVLGANYTMGASRFLAGYGQKDPDGVLKTKQFSLGYEYSLSKRTYLYVEASNKKEPLVPAATATTSRNFYSMGISHNF